MHFVAFLNITFFFPLGVYIFPGSIMGGDTVYKPNTV